ncbi:hypothetical protein GUJ93_ZPchr0010g9080 [Zizania palustris]|uniref:Uncharacterized protein n=1 Tax=Zizania palustris TaxID=103762 RepID=A0A8J5SZB2_ZIZPA|nr:hypothetical protein GUJ93_ZPchr0010g9080 [Zizania palustris]
MSQWRWRAPHSRTRAGGPPREEASGFPRTGICSCGLLLYLATRLLPSPFHPLASPCARLASPRLCVRSLYSASSPSTPPPRVTGSKKRCYKSGAPPHRVAPPTPSVSDEVAAGVCFLAVRLPFWCRVSF